MLYCTLLVSREGQMARFANHNNLVEKPECLIANLLLAGAVLLLVSFGAGAKDQQVTFDSDGWQIVGDLNVPENIARSPVAILLHTMWRGNRHEYDDFARTLAEAGIASLRIDLRGHGDSINKGKLAYLDIDPAFVFDAWPDVNAARAYLATRSDLDAARIAIVSASYSGELAAKAGRSGGYADAYVVLASGLLSLESVFRLQLEGVPFLFVYAKDDHTWAPKMAEFVTRRKFGELWTYEEGGHATALLTSQPGLPSRLASWLKGHLVDQ